MSGEAVVKRVSPLSALPRDYAERVYAGVLGKLIGVYLGRPIEGWLYERIAAELGEVSYYVHDRLGVPLVVADDDLTGTFTFLRALPDNGNDEGVTAEQIGDAWLNYIVENRTALWWGGLGVSTEHTAFLRLKHGVRPPRSGSTALNGDVAAEQIGGQIFIDGWGMVAPGRPELAAEFARRAACVSHDGEAIHAAVLLAAMEAQAFVDDDIDRLLDVGLSLIPRTSAIAAVIGELRAWRRDEPDWRRARMMLEAAYGYDRYPGDCHVVPNHALIILALLYGDGDFDQSMLIVNTCGWDTDCNSGNLGCLLGIRGGLATFEGGPDWRGPVADGLYLPGADGGICVTDAVTESYRIVNIGRALVNERPLAPKGGARFMFALPGSVQGFRVESGDAVLENSVGDSGERELSIRTQDAAGPVEVATSAFIPPELLEMPKYGELVACPLLYPGQTVHADVVAASTNVEPVSCSILIRRYGAAESLVTLTGGHRPLAPGERGELEWEIPDLGGQPVAAVGIVLAGRDAQVAIGLRSLSWSGEPSVVLRRPAEDGRMWTRAWVNAADVLDTGWDRAYRMAQNGGRGLLIQGTRDWRDYRVAATLYSDLAEAIGLAARVQGLRRYYAVLLGRDGVARLIRVLDGEHLLEQRTLAPWSLARAAHELTLEASGSRLRAWLGGDLLFDHTDTDVRLDGGAAALVCESGTLNCDEVRVMPAGIP